MIPFTSFTQGIATAEPYEDMSINAFSRRDGTYGLDADDGVRVRFANTRDQLVLASGHVESRAVEALALPFRCEPRDDDNNVGTGGQSDCVVYCLVGVDLLATAETLCEGCQIKKFIYATDEGLTTPRMRAG